MKDLTIIIPAYNEAESLKSYLPELVSYCNQERCLLIIVNDGSRDETANVLKNYANERASLIPIKSKGRLATTLEAGYYIVRFDLGKNINWSREWLPASSYWTEDNNQVGAYQARDLIRVPLNLFERSIFIEALSGVLDKVLL